MPSRATASVCHRASPFRRLKMILGGVGISYVRRIILANDMYIVSVEISEIIFIIYVPGQCMQNDAYNIFHES